MFRRNLKKIQFSHEICIN